MAALAHGAKVPHGGSGDTVGGSQGGRAESHSHHSDQAPTWKDFLGGREKGREGRIREREKGRKERRCVLLHGVRERKEEGGGGFFSLKGL